MQSSGLSDSLANQEAISLTGKRKSRKREHRGARALPGPSFQVPTGLEVHPLNESRTEPEANMKDPVKAVNEIPLEVVPVGSRASKKQRAAADRNVARVTEANKKDKKLMSKYTKYLPKGLSEILPEPIVGPDDAFEPDGDFLRRLAEVAATKVMPPKPSPIRFSTEPESIAKNSQLLSDYGFDLDSLISDHQDTTLGYGSEFRPVDQIQMVLGGHPRFTVLKDLIENGMDYRFKKGISEEERLIELRGMIERGNHKSADTESEKAGELLSKDVVHGFSIPVSPGIVEKIKGAMVQPFGLATQFGLAADGSRKVKHRLTQDLSFSLTKPEMSVNSRIDMDQYPEMFYGWCISRVIHFIVSLRIAYPHRRIFISKYDYSDAYRRMAHSAKAAAQSIAILLTIAYIAIRLTFGGSPNPPSFCLFSEMVTDLANEIANSSSYDPKTLTSPSQPRTPEPILSLSTAPLTKGLPLGVIIPVTHTARVDTFIDDLINCFLDTEANRDTQPHVVPLAMHCTSRPHAGEDEPITRRDILSGPKLIAEGAPREEQVVLGWLLDTHLLLIKLPVDKYDAWILEVRSLRIHRVTTYADIDSLVGKLNHVAFLIPLARHFLTRLRSLINRDRPQQQQITASKQVGLDCELWEGFLTKASQGISMNRITVRQPTRLAVSDSCPFGIGGFLLEGRAWRVRIPASSPIYGQSTANNFLEFLGMVVNVWLMCETFTEQSEALLVIGDNTSAIGWLFRSSRISPDSLYYDALQLGARKLATLITNSEHCLASQHIKGDANLVADLLSWSGDVRGTPHPLAMDHPSDDELTLRFHSHLPQLIPESFQISPLPNEILSWITLALQTVESSWTRRMSKGTKQATESGGVGDPIVSTPECLTTASSLSYPKRQSTSSFAPSSASIEQLNGASQEDWTEDIRSHWSQALSKLPQAVWLRRFGTISNQVPFTSREVKTCTHPSKLSSEPSTT
jgi:hypothetical protein